MAFVLVIDELFTSEVLTQCKVNSVRKLVMALVKLKSCEVNEPTHWPLTVMSLSFITFGYANMNKGSLILPVRFRTSSSSRDTLPARTHQPSFAPHHPSHYHQLHMSHSIKRFINLPASDQSANTGSHSDSSRPRHRLSADSDFSVARRTTSERSNSRIETSPIQRLITLSTSLR